MLWMKSFESLILEKELGVKILSVTLSIVYILVCLFMSKRHTTTIEEVANR